MLRRVFLMNTTATPAARPKSPKNLDRYARAIAASKRVRWEIEPDVLRGRTFDHTHELMPVGLSLASRLPRLDDRDRVLFSQIQGRTYANMFGLLERIVNAKVLDLTHHHLFGNQTALEALVRFSDEELKHQELFRRVELLIAEAMPSGYRFAHDATAVAGVVLGKSSWSVLALTCVIELVTQAHYKESILPEVALSPLFKDVFRFHWLEESQHAVLDELEWEAEDGRLTPEQRSRAVADLVALVRAVDDLVCSQAASDTAYFLQHAGTDLDEAGRARVASTFTAAYRYQYLLSGVARTRFPEILRSMVTDADFGRVAASLPTQASP